MSETNPIQISDDEVEVEKEKEKINEMKTETSQPDNTDNDPITEIDNDSKNESHLQASYIHVPNEPDASIIIPTNSENPNEKESVINTDNQSLTNNNEVESNSSKHNSAFNNETKSLDSSLFESYYHMGKSEIQEKKNDTDPDQSATSLLDNDDSSNHDHNPNEDVYSENNEQNRSIDTIDTTVHNNGYQYSNLDQDNTNSHESQEKDATSVHDDENIFENKNDTGSDQPPKFNHTSNEDDVDLDDEHKSQLLDEKNNYELKNESQIELDQTNVHNDEPKDNSYKRVSNIDIDLRDHENEIPINTVHNNETENNFKQDHFSADTNSNEFEYDNFHEKSFEKKTDLNQLDNANVHNETENNSNLHETTNESEHNDDIFEQKERPTNTNVYNNETENNYRQRHTSDLLNLNLSGETEFNGYNNDYNETGNNSKQRYTTDRLNFNSKPSIVHNNEIENKFKQRYSSDMSIFDLKDFESKTPNNNETENNFEPPNFNLHATTDESEYANESEHNLVKKKISEPNITTNTYVHNNEFENNFEQDYTNDYTSNVDMDSHATTNESEYNFNEKKPSKRKTNRTTNTQDSTIRNRHNQNQESSSSPSNNNITSSKHSNVKADKTGYSIFTYTIFILIIASSFYYFNFYQLSTKTSSLRKFADTTNNIFREMNNIDLPDVNLVKEHTVKCRSAANTFERTTAFKSYGSKISTGLRDFGNKIFDASQSLQKMYSKGSSLHTSFEIEVVAMLQRLDSNSNYMRKDDAIYFKGRLFKLMAKLSEFRQSVDKVYNSLLDAEKTRQGIESHIENGSKEAEQYSSNKKYSTDIDKAKKELAVINNISSELRINTANLDDLRNILKDHELELSDVSDELGDETGKIDRNDLRHLKFAMDNSKNYNNRFNKLALVSE